MKPLKAVEKYFGYKSFRPGQQEIIENILNGENVLAVLPTGAGKSLCYQIPALISDNFSIIISPLIALMKNQVDSLNHLNNLAAFINSTMNYNEAEEVLQNIAFGKTKILYVAPERLEGLNFVERIKNLNPTFLFIDEAHCISEWGHNFRPSYSKIKKFIEYTGVRNISAFTATATPEVVNDIVNQLGLKSPKIFVRGFERKNLHLNVITTKSKKQKCVELISRFKTPALIYTSSRKKAEEISEFLNLNRINCAYYHAGMPNIQRKKIQEDFLNDKIPIIAATNAFGMGIDKKDIRLIIHYNTPGSIENYYQEIGRAGRDGNDSHIYLLYDDTDINIQNYFIENLHPDKKLIQNIYSAICDYNRIAEGDKPDKALAINFEYISAYSKKNITKGILHSALRILESANYIKQLSELDRKISLFFSAGKEQLKGLLKKSSNDILKETALLILREYGSGVFQNKIEISLSRLSAKSNLSEIEIDDALTILDSLGFAEYSKPISKESIILTSPRVKIENIILNYKKMNESYLNQQKKLNLMIDYVFTRECRFKFILNYFGEDVSDYSCGKCDKCQNGNQSTEASFDYIKELILKTIYNIQKPLDENSIIKILRGSTKSKYILTDTFGSCLNYPKEDLKTIIKNLISQSILKRSSRTKLELSEEALNFLKSKNIFQDKEQISSNYEEDLELFNLLRESRREASQKFLQTNFLICPDEVLREIVSSKPKTQSELLSIKGFNSRMYNKLGDSFLEIIDVYLQNKEKSKNGEEAHVETIPQNIKETYLLLKKGYTLKDIASLRNLSEPVISMQIETIIEYQNNIDIKNLFSEGTMEKIFNEIDKGYDDLKELKKRLPENISYPQIRIAVSKAKAVKIKSVS